MASSSGITNLKIGLEDTAQLFSGTELGSMMSDYEPPMDSVFKPQRIQLKRTKGWRMPANTVNVDHTTQWGNPFIPGKENPLIPGRIVEDRRHAWSLFLGFAPLNEKLVAAARAELKGKNLACWCPLPGPYEQDCCHASVLLSIANRK